MAAPPRDASLRLGCTPDVRRRTPAVDDRPAHRRAGVNEPLPPSRRRLEELIARAQMACEAGAAADVADTGFRGGANQDGDGIGEAPGGLRLADPRRACVETNLARKGLWQLSGARGGGELAVRVLDGADRLGPVRRLDRGPRLGALELQLMVWLCARWREGRAAGSDRVALTLERLAEDLGWTDGGHNRRQIARALDALRMASFKARIYDARSGELRVMTFGLLDRWEAGIPNEAGRRARPGFAVLGDWLHHQLLAGYLTYVDWDELRALRRPTGKRLLLFLEAERFPPGGVWRRSITRELLDGLGVDARRTDNARATLRAAATEVEAEAKRYEQVSLERTAQAGWRLVVRRRAA